MSASDLNRNADPTVPTTSADRPGDDRRAAPGSSCPVVPVICDKCRETGFAGDDAFSAIPDILNFTPVQRRAHVNGWN